MPGRPINEDRQRAIALGLQTYTGAPHKHCGKTLRYVSGGHCVHCARMLATDQRDRRKYLQTQAENTQLDKPEPMALEVIDDAEARRQASFDELM